MVKNYLASAVRPIRNGWMNANSAQLYKDYKEMYDISLASFRRFVQEPFESILWEEPVDDNESYTRANWQAIKDLWHKKPCNVFWAGADTLMLRPTKLFDNQFHEYRLFNYTDPREIKGQPYYNNDLQYYPCTMQSEVWKQGEELWAQCETHPARNWGFDQLRNNVMFWGQGIADPHHPELAYQAMNMRSLDPNIVAWHDQWNGIPFSQAHILHFHASRGSRDVINLMKTLSDQL
jgi:hypothetical protein